MAKSLKARQMDYKAGITRQIPAASQASAANSSDKDALRRLQEQQQVRLEELRRIENEAAYATTVEQADEIEKRRKAAEIKLNATRDALRNTDPESIEYLGKERIANTAKGYSGQWLGSQASSLGTILAGGNALQEASSEKDRAINDSLYSGWATDELTRQNFTEAGPESAGVLEENREAAQKVLDYADRTADRSGKQIMMAKENLGLGGQLAVDLGGQAIQVGLDALTGLPNLSLASRSFGGAAQEARQDGQDVGTQFTYGALQGAKEFALNKALGGISKVYGKSAVGKAFDGAFAKIIKNPVLASALDRIFNTEGIEEGLSALLDPGAKALAYKDVGLREAYSELEIEDVLYNAAVGQLMGILGGGEPRQQPQNAVQAEASQEAAGRTETQGDESVPPRTQQAVQGTSDELNSGFPDGGAPIVYERGRDSYGLPTKDASQMVTEPTAVPQDRLYRQEPNSKSARREIAQDLERQRINSLVQADEPSLFRERPYSVNGERGQMRLDAQQVDTENPAYYSQGQAKNEAQKAPDVTSQVSTPDKPIAQPEQSLQFTHANDNITNSKTSRSVSSPYGTQRTVELKDAIDFLERNSDSSNKVDSLMKIPEVAFAEERNKGEPTVDLPDRQHIVNSAYMEAMKKGSWSGEDYSGPIHHDKRVDIVIGLPGSGKSSVYTEKLSMQHRSRVIDTDDYREYIPEYNGINAFLVHGEARKIKNLVLESSLKNGENILISTVGEDAKALERQIDSFKDLGYSVYLHLNELPNNKAISRALGRFVSDDGTLGRYISPALIADYGDSPTQTYLYLTRKGAIQNANTSRMEESLQGRDSGGIIQESESGNGKEQTKLSGYDWYSNDVAKGQSPKLIESFDSKAKRDKLSLADNVGQENAAAEDTSLPFTFGDEPAVEEPVEAAPVPDVEPETKQPETQPTPTPKQTAKERYDFAYGNIKAKADNVDKLKMFSESKDFKGFHGENASYAASQEVGKYKKLIRDFSNGHISLTKLRDAFAEMRTNPYMKNFSSQYIVDYLDTAISAEEAFDSPDASLSDANRYRHAVSNAIDMIAARAEKVNRAVSNQIAIANQIKNRKKPKSPVGNALNHMYTLQLNGPTIFKMIDGFEKAKGGIGYAMQRAAEDCAAVKAIEMTNGKRFFSKFKPGNGYTDFIRGKTMTGVKIGSHELNQQEAITLLGMVRTMRATSSIKMNGLSGIMYYANGEEKLYNFTGDAAVELEALEEKLKGSIKGVARDYEKAMDSMFSYFWPKLAAETRAINGRTGPKGMASYFPLRIKPKNKSLQDFSLEKSLENDYPDYIDGKKPGILKERSDTTGGYLVLEPCSVVVDRYIQQASDYIAYADFGNTLELMNTGSALAPGMSETMEAAWGKNFSKWMAAYVNDMTGVSRSSERNSFDEAIFPLLKKGRQNLAQGALLANISTPIKQAAGYWPAMGIIKPTSMMRAILAGKTSAKWNPLIEDRRSSLDPTVAELLTETDTWLGKLKSKDNAIGRTIRNVTEWIPKADAGVVNMLFKATVVDVATDNPGLSKNSAEFKRLVESKFEQIMLRTQSTSYKSISAEIQRTDNEWAKMASMFRSQQTMEFNKVVQALGEYAATRGKDGSKEASKYLIDTLGGQIGSALTFGILTVAANLVLHKYDRYEDEEGQIRAANIIKSIAFDSIETMAGVAWLGDAVAQFAIETISGGEENEFYGLPLGVLNTVVNLLESFQYLADNPSVSNAKRFLGNLGNLKGVPVNNAYNLVNAVIMHMADLTGNNSQGYDDVIKYLKAQTKARNDAIDMLINAGLSGTGNVQADFGTTTDGIKAAQQQIKELKAEKDGEYDTKGSRAIVDIILGLDLTEKGTDAMVNEHTAKSYRETYSVLRAFGIEPKSAATLYNELDTSGNGNIDQKELLKAYKDNPGLSYILERIWNSREYTDSWDDVT